MRLTSVHGQIDLWSDPLFKVIRVIKVKIQFWDNRSGTNRDRFTQRHVILHVE